MSKKLMTPASLIVVVMLVLTACSQPTPESIIKTQVVEVVKTQIVEVAGTPQVVMITPTPLPPEPTKEFKSKDPTTYTLALFSDPETLDTAMDYESAGGNVLMNVYDTLIYYNHEDPNAFVPQLALEVPSLENGGISPDGLTFTFKIRKGVKFHDGTELTPTDVAYTFQRGILQGGYDSPQVLFTEPLLGIGISDIGEMIDTAVAGDPATLRASDPAKLLEVCQSLTSKIVADEAASTVTFHLVQSWAPFIATLAQSWGSILSKAWVVANGGWDGDCATWQNYYDRTSEELNALALGSSAMGTGPYILDHWTPNEEIVLKANENYWRTEPAWEGGPTGAPRLKTIIFTNVAEFSTRYAMLMTGDVDAIAVGSTSDWPQMDMLTGQICQVSDQDCQPTENPDEPLELIRGYPTTNRTDIFLNFNMNTEGGNNFIGSGMLDGNGVPANFFSDSHIRRAFAYCFNYDVYLEQVLMGEGVRSTTVMLPGMSGYDENAPAFNYDPAKCEEEFKLADVDKDGLPAGEDPDDIWERGFRLTIGYNTGNTQRQTIGQILQSELSALNENFVIEVTGLPWPTFLRNTRAQKLPISVSGWIEDYNDTHNWVRPYALTSFAVRQSFPQELTDQFTDIINRGVVEPDPAKRHEIYKEFNQLFYEQAPDLLLFIVNGRRYQQRWVEGWFTNPVFPGTYYYSMYKK